MGLYDQIRIAPEQLPGTPPAFARAPGYAGWQCKDLDCALATFEITPAGRLVLRRTLHTDGDTDTCAEDRHFHGVITFHASNVRACAGHPDPAKRVYATADGEDAEFVTYRATFTAGTVTAIEEVERERHPALPLATFHALHVPPVAPEQRLAGTRTAYRLSHEAYVQSKQRLERAEAHLLEALKAAYDAPLRTLIEQHFPGAAVTVTCEGEGPGARYWVYAVADARPPADVAGRVARYQAFADDWIRHPVTDRERFLVHT